jgi:hypothetical protein
LVAPFYRVVVGDRSPRWKRRVATFHQISDAHDVIHDPFAQYPRAKARARVFVVSKEVCARRTAVVAAVTP